MVSKRDIMAKTVACLQPAAQHHHLATQRTNRQCNGFTYIVAWAARQIREVLPRIYSSAATGTKPAEFFFSRNNFTAIRYRFSISVETLAAPTNLHTVSTPHHICRTQSARVTAGNLGVPEPTPIVRVLVRCHPWLPNRWKHDYSPSSKGKFF